MSDCARNCPRWVSQDAASVETPPTSEPNSAAVAERIAGSIAPTSSIGLAAARNDDGSALAAAYLAPVIRGLLDGVDQAVQVDGGREIWLGSLAVADGPGEEGVHLPD